MTKKAAVPQISSVDEVRTYPLMRGSRRGQIMKDWLFAITVQGVQDHLGGKWDDFIGKPVSEIPPLVYAALSSAATIDVFVDMVVHSDHSNGSGLLETVEGKIFSIPGMDAGAEELAQAYLLWLDVADDIIDAFRDRIQVLKGIVPHLRPFDQLTEEERNDPN
jgi:hypothetical protein